MYAFYITLVFLLNCTFLLFLRLTKVHWNSAKSFTFSLIKFSKHPSKRKKSGKCTFLERMYICTHCDDFGRFVAKAPRSAKHRFEQSCVCILRSFRADPNVIGKYYFNKFKYLNRELRCLYVSNLCLWAPDINRSKENLGGSVACFLRPDGVAITTSPQFAMLVTFDY